MTDSTSNTSKIAIIQTGGKQYVVQEGQTLKIEKLEGEQGAQVVFEQVLLRAQGSDLVLGKPLVAQGQVVGHISRHGRLEKVTGVKFKAKKRYQRIFGHKQHFTEVVIDTIK